MTLISGQPDGRSEHRIAQCGLDSWSLGDTCHSTVGGWQGMLGSGQEAMHELSVTQSLLEIALRHAQEAGAERVTDLYLVIGEWSSIIDDSVQFYWDMVAQGTPAEGARLHFERLPARAACGVCGQEFAPGGGSLLCPACGSSQLRVLSGDQFQLESIAIEPARPNPQAEAP